MAAGAPGIEDDVGLDERIIMSHEVKGEPDAVGAGGDEDVEGVVRLAVFWVKVAVASVQVCRSGHDRRLLAGTMSGSGGMWCRAKRF